MARVVDLKTQGPVKLSKHALRIYRIGLYVYAHEFYDIAKKTRKSVVKSYLLGHAMELYLKSYLMKQGYAIKQLKTKKYGHNITNLLKACVKKGLGNHLHISDELTAAVEAFSSSYADKAYEYFPFWLFLFQKSPPDTRRLSRFAKQLDSKLGNIIKED